MRTASFIIRIRVIVSRAEEAKNIYDICQKITNRDFFSVYQVYAYCFVFHRTYVYRRTASFFLRISRAEEAKNISDIEIHSRRRAVVVRRCSFVFVQHNTE